METPMKIKRKYTKKAKPVVEPAVEPTDEPDVVSVVEDVKPKRKYEKKVKPEQDVVTEAVVEAVKKERKENPWLVHVKTVKGDNPDKSYKEVLSLAKLSYKK